MSKELGTLVVVVLKARNLLDKHSFYKQDVFAQVTVQGTTKKTKIDVKGGQHPVWDEELRFPVLDQGKKGMMMEVSCWSKEPRSDDLVGKGELDITETLRTGEFDDWIPLSVNNVQRGDLYLEMTFYAAGPPPALSRRPSKMLPADRLARAPQTSPSNSAPSSPPLTLTAGHRPALSADSTHLRPQSAAAQRLSPRPKEHELPPLPEEPTPDGPSPGAVPAILRPGGGAAAHHRSRSSLSGSPGASFSTPGAQPPVSPPHQSSLPAPNSLRPGGGLSPVPHTSPSSRTSSYIPETQIPVLPATALGHVPASTPTPQPPRIASPEQSAYDYRPLHAPSATPTPYQPAHTPTPHQAVHTPTPQSSVHTPTPQTSVHTPAPHQPIHTSPHVYPAYDPRPQPAPSPQPHHQRTYSNPQEYLGYDPRPHPAQSPAPSVYPPASSAYPPAPYPPQAQSPPYEHRVPALPPQAGPTSSFSPPQAQWQAPPPASYPHLEPSTYAPSTFTPGVGGFAFPTASVPPPPPGGAYYPPYAPGPPPRPYPYNYAPPPRDPDDFEPRSNPRYQKPLPLPDEPAGTPTPAHPHGAASKANGHRHRKSEARSEGGGEDSREAKGAAKHEKPYESAEARDRRLAAEFEHEEEERRRVAREQEERDLELARKLDLELNLAEEEAAGATPTAETVSNGHAHANGNGSDMPGSWYRHRPEA